MVSPNFLDAVMVSGVYSELHPQSPHQDLKQKNTALMNVAKTLCKDLKAKTEECDEMEGSKNEKTSEIRKLKRRLEAWMHGFGSKLWYTNDIMCTRTTIQLKVDQSDL